MKQEKETRKYQVICDGEPVPTMRYMLEMSFADSRRIRTALALARIAIAVSMVAVLGSVISWLLILAK